MIKVNVGCGNKKSTSACYAGSALPTELSQMNALVWSHLIYSGCEAKDSQKSEINRCTSQEPNGDKERSFSFRCGRKTPENFSTESARNQVGTENPIQIMAPQDSNQGPIEVEGKERYHYANPTPEIMLRLCANLDPW